MIEELTKDDNKLLCWKLISVAPLSEFTFQVTAAVKNSMAQKALLGKRLTAGWSVSWYE